LTAGKTCIEGVIQSSIGIQAGNPSPGDAMHIIEIPAHENFAVGLHDNRHGGAAEVIEHMLKAAIQTSIHIQPRGFAKIS
jgi:hypothetical protein